MKILSQCIVAMFGLFCQPFSIALASHDLIGDGNGFVNLRSAQTPRLKTSLNLPNTQLLDAELRFVPIEGALQLYNLRLSRALNPNQLSPRDFEAELRWKLSAAKNAEISFDLQWFGDFSGPAFEFADALEFKFKQQIVRVEKAVLTPIRNKTRGELSLIDEKKNIWLYMVSPMHTLAHERGELNTLSSDVRIGPALAKALQLPHAINRVIGSFELNARFIPVLFNSPKSCDVPNWPGVGNYRADVLLEYMRPEFVKCRRSDASLPNCDGPGGDNGQVVMAPDVYLRNSNVAGITADVPWYTKFTSPSPPYNNDQHPFLLWNLYRVNAKGQLDQIARSGLKHAFATSNDGCADPISCPVGFNHILGAHCGDRYSIGSNELTNALAPRRDLYAQAGIWGRCGSVHDDQENTSGLPGCDGIEDINTNSSYDYRLIVRENEIEAGSNPAARYFMEAWYVVRDDINIFNTMGYQEFSPNWQTSVWNETLQAGFVLGSALDVWVPRGTQSQTQWRSELDLPNGHIHIASKVSDLAGNQTQYDYVVMNYDFAEIVTMGSEPNIRILDNRGLDAFEIPALNAQNVDDFEFSDGDEDPANDWVADFDGQRIRFSAPLGASLDWGSMFRFGFRSTTPSSSQNAKLEVAATSEQIQTSVLAPDVSALLRNGFE